MQVVLSRVKPKNGENYLSMLLLYEYQFSGGQSTRHTHSDNDPA